MQHTAAIDAFVGTEKDNKATGDDLVKNLTNQYNEIAKALELQKKLVAELRVLKDEQIRLYKLSLDKFHQKAKGK
jgi:hypothetical protein